MSGDRPEPASGPSSETKAFRDEVRAWIADHKPDAPSFTLPQSFLEVQTRAQFDYLRAWQRAVYEAGYLGYDVPEAYGGRGVDHTKHVIVMRELVAALGDVGGRHLLPLQLAPVQPREPGVRLHLLDARDLLRGSR